MCVARAFEREKHVFIYDSNKAFW